MSGTIYTFSPEVFEILDPAVTGIRISTLPINGVLTLSDTGVTAGQVISLADLTAGNLRFLKIGAQSLPYALFGFQYQDGSPSPLTNAMTLYFNTPQVNFINHLYNDILNRNAEANGITHWVDKSTQGTSNEQIASDLWGSYEHRAIQVDGYYHQFLDRNPDAAGREYWINQMLAGMSEAQVMANFMSTLEYRLDHPTTVDLVTAYYEDLFARSPDQNGLNYWTTQINTNQLTVHQVATNLVNTRERHLILVDTYYEDYLSRAPDAPGRLFWTNLLDSGALNDRTFALAIFSTPEYFNQ
jgi:hypothetical protein